MSRIKTSIVALSLGFNLAFAGVWLYRNILPVAPETSTPSSLHRHIGITRDQWTRLAPLVDGFKTASKERGEKITAIRCRILDLLEARTPDQNAIESARNQLCALTLDMKKNAFALLLEEKTVLSPKQYSALIKKIREKTCTGQTGCNKQGSVTRILINDPDLNTY